MTSGDPEGRCMDFIRCGWNTEQKVMQEVPAAIMQGAEGLLMDVPMRSMLNTMCVCVHVPV